MQHSSVSYISVAKEVLLGSLQQQMDRLENGNEKLNYVYGTESV